MILLQRLLPLIIFILIFISLQNGWRLELAFNPINTANIEQHKVLMYSTRWCRYCHKARQFFQQANIPFIELDIEKSAEAFSQYQLLGGQGVPVFHIGDQILQGYDRQKIRLALERLNHPP